MPLQYDRVVAAALAFGVAVAAVSAQSRDGAILPPGESGLVTVTGCLVRGNQVRGGEPDKYVLANPTKGEGRHPTDSACTVEAGANALTLDNAARRINESMLGHWVEISGRLEKENSTNPDTLRELDVEFARLVTPSPERAKGASSPAPAGAAPRASTEPRIR